MTHNHPTASAPDWDLIDRFLAGQCSPAEAERIQVHFGERDPERFSALVAELKHRAGPERDVETLLARFHTQRAIRERDGARRARWTALRIPAGIAAMGLVIGLIAQRVMVRNAEPRGESQAVGVGQVYTTVGGQRAVITLRDGTRVILAPQTTLRVDATFGASTRRVSLLGEAAFDVTPGSTAPFVVQTGALATRVLGTTFSVRQYPSERDVRVAVTTGRVSIQLPDARRAPFIVSAGAVVLATDSSAVSAAIDANQVMAWTRGRLMFRDATTREVLTELARWYDYEFRVTDSTISAQRLSVRLSTESLSAALSTLRLALDVDVVLDQRTVTLRPRRGASPAGSSRRVRTNALSTSNSEVGR